MRFQLYHVNWLLPPSCLSTHDTVNTVAVATMSDSGSPLNKEEKWERWLSRMAESLANLSPDCWIICVFCLTLCECDWLSIWASCKVNNWTYERSVIWTHREIRAGESPSFRNEIICRYESRWWLFYDCVTLIQADRVTVTQRTDVRKD